MANYKKRFTKEEFKKELMQHMSDMPPGFLKARDKLDKHVEDKANHYIAALAALDAAADKLRSVAASHPDPSARQDADEALKKIDDAINAYGDASMSWNNGWQDQN